MDATTKRIGAAARAAGVSVQTLHYYEREGLIPEPARSPAGYRGYEPATIRTVRAIKRAQTLGFTLREVRELMALRASTRSGAKVVAFAESKIREIDEKVAALHGIRRALLETVRTCACGGDLARCDVLAGLEEPPKTNHRASRRLADQPVEERT